MNTNRPQQPSPAAGRGAGSRSLLQIIRATPEDVVDVFVYVVVLNLAIEYLPAVLSESFTLSLITAVLLKLSLELVLIVKARAVARFRGAMTIPAKLTAALLLWATAAGSKIVVLERVNLVFGDAVSLGGFVSVSCGGEGERVPHRCRVPQQDRGRRIRTRTRLPPSSGSRRRGG